MFPNPNPNYCTLEEARETARRLTKTDTGGGVRSIYLPSVAPGSPWDVLSDPANKDRKQYEFVMANGNAEQSAGIWTYYLNRWWCKLIPDWIVCSWYPIPPGDGRPPAGVSWKEAYRP